MHLDTSSSVEIIGRMLGVLTSPPHVVPSLVLGRFMHSVTCRSDNTQTSTRARLTGCKTRPDHRHFGSTIATATPSHTIITASIYRKNGEQT